MHPAADADAVDGGAVDGGAVDGGAVDGGAVDDLESSGGGNWLEERPATTAPTTTAHGTASAEVGGGGNADLEVGPVEILSTQAPCHWVASEKDSLAHMATHGCPWTTIDSHEYIRISMDSH